MSNYKGTSICRNRAGVILGEYPTNPLTGDFPDRCLALTRSLADADQIAAALNRPRYLYQVWNAGNDTNGNSRRVTMVYRDAILVAALDDAYRGATLGEGQLPSVNCSAKDYRDAIHDEDMRRIARTYLNDGGSEDKVVWSWSGGEECHDRRREWARALRDYKVASKHRDDVASAVCQVTVIRRDCGGDYVTK